MGAVILKTTGDVMEALGGNAAVQELTGSRPQAVSNWRSALHFPADTFLLMSQALERQGFAASPALWRQRQANGAGQNISKSEISFVPRAPSLTTVRAIARSAVRAWEKRKSFF